jgi:hypothetical protein
MCIDIGVVKTDEELYYNEPAQSIFTSFRQIAHIKTLTKIKLSMRFETTNKSRLQQAEPRDYMCELFKVMPYMQQITLNGTTVSMSLNV